MALVHCKRASYDVYIGRPSDGRAEHWGNPFSNRPGTRAARVVDDPIDAFRQWLYGEEHQEIEPARRSWILANIGSLHDQVLGCWCAPNPCHGEVLKELLSDWLAESINGAGEFDPDGDDLFDTPAPPTTVAPLDRQRLPWDVPADLEATFHPLPYLPEDWVWTFTGSHAFCRAVHTPSGVRTKLYNRGQADIRRSLLNEIDILIRKEMR